MCGERTDYNNSERVVQDFLLVETSIVLSVPTSFLQGSKVCDPREGTTNQSYLNSVFFVRLLLFPLLFPQPAMTKDISITEKKKYCINIYSST
jgi:hypothetical protein